MIIFIFFASSKIAYIKVWTDSSLLKGVDRSDNRQFLDNKIQYAIRSVQFVKLSFLVSFVVSGSAILAKYSPA
jgi:hypothetical protein